MVLDAGVDDGRNWDGVPLAGRGWGRVNIPLVPSKEAALRELRKASRIGCRADFI